MIDARPRLDRPSPASSTTPPTTSPTAYRDTIFIGNVVTNRINHDRLEWHGSTPKAIDQPDFLVERRPLVPARRHQARPRRGALRRRLLQPDHRPLRGAADPPRPRPRARPDLADRLQGGRHDGEAAAAGDDGRRSPSPTWSRISAIRTCTAVHATNILVERGGEASDPVRQVADADANP